MRKHINHFFSVIIFININAHTLINEFADFE